MRRHATALTLYDARGQEAGSLVVELRDPAASVDEPVIDSADDDYDRSRPTSPPITDPVQEPVEDSDSGILAYLRTAVEKTKLVAGLLGETAEVRPGFIAQAVSIGFTPDSLDSLAHTQILLGTSWNQRSQYVFFFKIIGVEILIARDRPLRGKLPELRHLRSSSSRWSMFIHLLMKVMPGTRFSVLKTLSSASHCKRLSVVFSFCIIPPMRVSVSSYSALLMICLSLTTSLIPTSPATNLGHAEHRITSLENAYATQGGTWNRKNVTNSLHVGSTSGACGIARYELFSLILCPKLRLTRR